MKDKYQSEIQALGRYFRAGRTVEQRVADRVKAKLLITDETVLLKNGRIIMLGQSEGVGHIIPLTKNKRLVR